MLDAVAETSKNTIQKINDISIAIQKYKNTLREKTPKIYSQDLLNNLFRNPFTKIEYLMSDLKISRNTAIRYLEQLEKVELIKKKKVGRENFYANKSLLNILINPITDL